MKSLKFMKSIDTKQQIFEILGDFFPSFGAHLIICARSKT